MTQYLRPASDISVGSWTDEGASFNDGNLYTSVQEVTQDGDTSYIDCPNGGGTAEVKLGSVTDPGVNTGHVVHIYGEGVGSGGPERIDIYLYEGGTLRATVVANWGPGRTGYVDINYPLTTIEADSLSAYDDLRIRLDEANIGGGEHFKVTQIYMEVPDPSGTDTSDNTPAYMKGSDDAVDNLDAYVEGSGPDDQPAISAARFRVPKREIDSQDAFTQGVLPADDNQSAFLYGSDDAIDNAPAYVAGWDTDVSSLDAYLQGWATFLHAVEVYLKGQDTEVDNLSAYTMGSADSANAANAYLEGSLGSVDNTPAFLKGSAVSTDTQSAYLAGSLDTTASQDAYTQGIAGATSSVSAYTESAGTETLDSVSSFIEGEVGEVYVAMKTVNCNTSTGTQDITTTDLSNTTPKGAILITWRADVDGVQEDHFSRCVGMADGINNHGSVIESDGAWQDVIHSYDRIAGVVQAMVWEGHAIFDSFINNGIRIDWTKALSDDWMLTVIFFSGDDVSADVHRMDATSANSSYTEDLGFIPSLLFAVADIGGGEGASGALFQGTGIAVNADHVGGLPPQVSQSWWWKYYLSKISGDMYVYDTKFLWRTQFGLHSYQIDGFTGNGYKWSVAGGTYDDAWCLAVDLAGKEVYVGIQDTPTSTGDWVVEDPRFTAEFVMMLSGFAQSKNVKIESTPSVPNADVGAVGMSIFNETEERSSAIEFEMGNVAIGNNRQQINSEIVDMDQDDGTTGFDATLISLDADGFTANFSNTLGVARKWPILVIGTDEWTKSTAGAYLEGLGTGATSSKSAYLTGPIPASDSKSAFLEGVPFVASTPAYTAGVATVIDSQSAFLSGPIDLADSTPSYLEGAMIYYVNDSISAYMMSGLAEDSTPAYIEGATIWPFTDDFTGTDVDPWNIAKWVAEEY